MASCEKVVLPFEAIVKASVSDADPIVPLFGMTNAPEPPLSVSTPVELRAIFSAAASDAAVLKLSFVALLPAAKVPSDTASIPAATKIASVLLLSSGAWKLIAPRTSLTAISVSPVCSVSKNGLLSAVAADFSSIPSSGSWVIVTSLLAPRFSTAASERRARSLPT